MKDGWPLLVGVLVYITLDLSLPSMPGAFVFDVDESVESVQMSRIRGADDTMPARAPARDADLAAEDHVRAAARPLVRLVGSAGGPLRTRTHLPRATTASPIPSEDSH